MATTSVTVRMEEGLKKQAEALFEDMGLNMTTAFTVFARAVVRQGKIPFEITGDPFYSETNMRHLRKAAEDMKAGRNVAEHELIEAGDDEEDLV